MYANLRTPAEVAADESAARQQWPCDIKPRPKHGLHDQGRYPEFADTIPTRPAHLDGAHACSDIGHNDDTPKLTLWQRLKRWWIDDYTGRSFL